MVTAAAEVQSASFTPNPVLTQGALVIRVSVGMTGRLKWGQARGYTYNDLSTYKWD